MSSNQKASFTERMPKRRKRNPWTEVEINLLDIAMDEVPEGQPLKLALKAGFNDLTP